MQQPTDHLNGQKTAQDEKSGFQQSSQPPSYSHSVHNHTVYYQPVMPVQGVPRPYQFQRAGQQFQSEFGPYRPVMHDFEPGLEYPPNAMLDTLSPAVNHRRGSPMQPVLTSCRPVLPQHQLPPVSDRPGLPQQQPPPFYRSVQSQSQHQNAPVSYRPAQQQPYSYRPRQPLNPQAQSVFPQRQQPAVYQPAQPEYRPRLESRNAVPPQHQPGVAVQPANAGKTCIECRKWFTLDKPFRKGNLVIPKHYGPCNDCSLKRTSRHKSAGAHRNSRVQPYPVHQAPVAGGQPQVPNSIAGQPGAALGPLTSAVPQIQPWRGSQNRPTSAPVQGQQERQPKSTAQSKPNDAYAATYIASLFPLPPTHTDLLRCTDLIGYPGNEADDASKSQYWIQRYALACRLDNLRSHWRRMKPDKFYKQVTFLNKASTLEYELEDDEVVPWGPFVQWFAMYSKATIEKPFKVRRNLSFKFSIQHLALLRELQAICDAEKKESYDRLLSLCQAEGVGPCGVLLTQRLNVLERSVGMHCGQNGCLLNMKFKGKSIWGYPVSYGYDGRNEQA
ncbi:hypothetical protein CC86DRAFT_404928 [Ophiobolus disseminans]|uniref:Uncharacterized protein n=1 Tax=Ophiobolus disseminans TaxID=1469910 RepID=A0A6A7A425_9PLEO|nr:hypothetical protein CC86DRAFT_404928 [Ophiobolus disseminans]